VSDRVSASLKNLLDAREERALMQKFFLSCPGVIGAPCVVQLSLNIPGWPKRLKGDELALSRGAEALCGALSGIGVSPLIMSLLSNAAGEAVYYICDVAGDAAAAGVKRVVAEVEESAEWGRVLDIDVITVRGQISRADVGFAPRKCLICTDDAKICARRQRHPVSELREMTGRLLGLLGKRS
jgi:holo-ACP synthase CitX